MDVTTGVIIILSVAAAVFGVLIAHACLSGRSAAKKAAKREERIQEYLQKYGLVETSDFSSPNSRVILCEPARIFLVVNYYDKAEEFIPLYFDAIAGMSVVEDGEEQGVVEGAIKGGLLFGRIGAIFGAFGTKPYVSNKQVVVYTKLIANPTVVINVINKYTVVQSEEYHEADMFIAQCESVVRTIAAGYYK